MKRLVASLILTCCSISCALALSVTMTTAQKVKLTIPATVTNVSVKYAWLQGSNCDDAAIQFTTVDQKTIYIVSGSKPCKGDVFLQVTGTIGGSTQTVADVVSVTITSATAGTLNLTATAAETKP